ncbi:DUF6191 domain-containing protein [Streptomyces millisiae]|uniref:DUF6191 domain-containing protein n=1 Tax=Streptomyces millisiae TaxID=3075542 RepID=A0ABU2LU07_9ACTN|nr:DUF6191 domain-containing protein [Streptomyces sp. DSM 44918]MDT0321084.1 DUF6191 domain-containing protein [Streptomyces sp. DSM 44918]
MEFVLFMTLPGLVIGLIALAFVDRFVLVRFGRSRGRVSATGFEMLHASLLPGKDHELAQREVMTLLRDEEGDATPPRSRVDLTGGTAVIRLPDDRA